MAEEKLLDKLTEEDLEVLTEIMIKKLREIFRNESDRSGTDNG